MAWIAFASVPTVLVVMLAMGQLEERLLPETPPPNGEGDPTPAPPPTPTPITLRVDAGRRATRPAAGGPRWEVVVGPVEDREEART